MPRAELHCHAACSNAESWVGNETRVTAASFNSRLAPVARGFFLGDYMGLDNMGNTFTPFFTQTTATDAANEYFATARP